MKYLELNFSDAASNLACDEALLDHCEAANDGEILRLWEPANHFVVLGYSNRTAVEVDMAVCGTSGIAIFRRFTGGGAVLQGPGCLNYTLVIKNSKAGYIGDVAASYGRVLQRHRALVRELTGEKVEIEGSSDLAIGGQKFSGNAQHRKQRYSVFHGTFLLNLNLSLIETCLPMPSREPRYRQRRSHRLFLRNLEINGDSLRDGLKETWGANEKFDGVPHKRIDDLIEQRYSRKEWNHKF